MRNKTKPNYIIKFADETYLTKPDATPFANYYKDHANPWDRSIAKRFSSKAVAIIVKWLVGGDIVTTLETTETYEMGKTYMTIGGGEFTVTEVKDSCVCDVNGHHRYNRKNLEGVGTGWDNGRTIGSPYTKDCLRYPPVEIIK